MGATFFQNNSIIAWFNDEFYHSVPLTLNLLNRGILKNVAGKNYDIIVRSKPFHCDALDKEDEFTAQFQIMLDINLLVGLGTVFSSWLAVFTIFYIGERAKKAKLLQMICGVNKFIFWLVPFIVDLILFLVVTIFLLAIVAAFNLEYFNEFSELLNLFGITTCFAFAAFPLSYLFTHLFTKPATGESMTALFGIGTGKISSRSFKHLLIPRFFLRLNFIWNFYGICHECQ